MENKQTNFFKSKDFIENIKPIEILVYTVGIQFAHQMN